MDNPKLLKRQSATVIHRYIQRVILCNRSHVIINSMMHIDFRCINDFTTLGTSVSDLDHMYRFMLPASSPCTKAYYMYDIRELYQILRTSYNTAYCPYTRKPFTPYQKYRILRYYHYAKRTCAKFEDLVFGSIGVNDYTSASQLVNSLMDEYNNFDIEEVTPSALLCTLQQLVRWVPTFITSLDTLNMAHYHHMQGNMRNFRNCVYVLLIEGIQNSSEKFITQYDLKSRFAYSMLFDYDGAAIVSLPMVHLSHDNLNALALETIVAGEAIIAGMGETLGSSATELPNFDLQELQILSDASFTLAPVPVPVRGARSRSPSPSPSRNGRRRIEE
jgi:hypothetical protein